MVRRNRWLMPETRKSVELIDALRSLARPLREPDDLKPLLLGEASHGTSEYYSTATNRLLSNPEST